MRTAFLGILVASLGSTIMWLLLVPYFDQTAHSSGLVGMLGMERQIMMVAGSLLVGVWADRGRVIRKFALLEGAQLALAVVFLVLLGFSPDLDPAFVLVWTAVRFAVVGASTVLAYRLLADLSGSSSRGAVFHMVTSPQGAMVFASVVCVLIPVWTTRSITVALTVDVVTAAAVLVFLLARGPRLESSSGSLAFGWRAVGRHVVTALRGYWLPELRPWSWVQLCFLVSLSGMMVYGYAIAERLPGVPAAIGFAASWFFYGLAFWVTAPLVRTGPGARQWGVVFAAALAAAGVLGAITGLDAVATHVAIYLALTFVNAFWLHYTNARILERAPGAAIGQVRASMLFYLGVVFGVGEQLVGFAVQSPTGNLLLGLARLAGGLALLAAAILWGGGRGTRTSIARLPDAPPVAAGHDR
ncbi:hypothetical protein [Amycolatopsis samaneae]|uniref:MFS transporter n=1 Tax=Amycolatopsis samaneae TaxID=664691 RepID=A0ABW5GSI1_9PSEU